MHQAFCVLTDLDIYEQQDRIADNAGGPEVAWTYRHGSHVDLVRVALLPFWPELRVWYRPDRGPIIYLGTFSPTGRLRQMEIETAGDDAEISAADLRRPGVIRVLREWAVAGRRVAEQLTRGVPLDKTVIDAKSPTEALRMVDQAEARRRPAKVRRGSEHEDLIRQVAEAYKEEIAAGNSRPRIALARRFNYTPEHIGALLVKARKPRNGEPPLLGPTRPGKAGEEPAGPPAGAQPAARRGAVQPSPFGPDRQGNAGGELDND